MSIAALVNALALPPNAVLGMGHSRDKREIAEPVGTKSGPSGAQVEAQVEAQVGER
jgi:hypothetical protein